MQLAHGRDLLNNRIFHQTPCSAFECFLAPVVALSWFDSTARNPAKRKFALPVQVIETGVIVPNLGIRLRLGTSKEKYHARF